MKGTNTVRNLMVLPILSLLLGATLASAQVEIESFGSTIVYEPPDSAVWHLAERNYLSDRNVGYVIFKRQSILDSTGREIIPNLAIIYEEVSDSADLIVYSFLKRQNARFQVVKVLGPDSHVFSFANAIGYEGTYPDREIPDIVHRILVGHMLHARTGLQVMGDATDEVFPKVEQEVRRFLHSVRFKE